MYALLALVSLLVAVFSFYNFQTKGTTLYLILGVVFALLTAVFGVIFLSGRINKTDDIHITE